MISQEYIKSILHYDHETGLFSWIKSPANCIKIGQIAGTITSNGYVRIKINQKKYLAHRIAWIYFYGSKLPNNIDHINGIRSDNKISNLREATQSENNKNAKIRKDNSSGHKGVSWDKNCKKWLAYCSVNGKRHHLGCFDNKESAALKYKEFAELHHGEFYSNN